MTGRDHATLVLHPLPNCASAKCGRRGRSAATSDRLSQQNNKNFCISCCWATRCSWASRSRARITADDILVVAPYNLQVKLLQRTLPANARVGTVDKFQGQEAAVSIVSMTTSSEEDLPSHLEFLFSKNRLNVAISRARCLSIVVANPRLLDVRCKTPGEIALVNTLCWATDPHLP